MLYIALGGKEGAPTISLNKIFEFINPKPPAEAAEAAQDGNAAEAVAPEASAAASETAATPEASAAASETVAASTAPASASETAAASAPTSETATASAPAAPEGRTEAAKDGEAAEEAAFASMEELTEFYRKEAERLTGIKH
jgi:hypothetical protein